MKRRRAAASVPGKRRIGLPWQATCRVQPGGNADAAVAVATAWAHRGKGFDEMHLRPGRHSTEPGCLPMELAECVRSSMLLREQALK